MELNDIGDGDAGGDGGGDGGAGGGGGGSAAGGGGEGGGGELAVTALTTLTMTGTEISLETPGAVSHT